LAADGCTIGDKVILPFSALDLVAGASQISPESIFVKPLAAALGLLFEINANAASGELLQSRFAFTVMGDPGAQPIGRVTTSIAGSRVAPDGVNTAVTDLCFGAGVVAGVCATTGGTVILFDIGSDALLQESRGFAPVQTLGVANDITLDGGSSGSAGLSSYTIRFQAVPEPATFVPIGAGVAALILLRRRR
jgi:hypothetical protein